MKRHQRPAVLATVAAAALLMAGCSSGGGSGASSTVKVRVGMFEEASNSLFDQIQAGFQQAFLAKTGLKPDQVQWVEKNAEGSESAIETIAQQFAGSDVSTVEVLGTPAVLALAHLDKHKPIIAVAMGDPVGAGVAKSLNDPGGNVTGSIDYVDPSDLLNQLAHVQPRFRQLGTIYNPSNENMQVWVKALKSAAAARDIPVLTAPISSSSSVPAAARSLQGRADAVLIGPDEDVETALPAVAGVAKVAKQQLFRVGGDAETPGVLATLGPDYPALGAAAGGIAAEVYQGTPPGKVPFARPASVQVTVNKSTEHALGVTLSAAQAGG